MQNAIRILYRYDTRYESGQNEFKFTIKRNSITSDTANVTSDVTTDVTSIEELNRIESTVWKIKK